MRHAATVTAAFALLIASLVPASCAHFNSPGGTLACMENSKDEKAAEQLVFAMLDQDSTAALDAAFVLTPDLVKCLLQKAATAKSAGGAAGERAKKAQRYLDAHGLASLRSSRLEWRWALPFEDMGIVVEVRPPGSHLSCPRGLQAYAWPPYAIDAVCVTTDPTFDESRVVAQVGDTLVLLSRPPGIGPGAGGG